MKKNKAAAVFLCVFFKSLVYVVTFAILVFGSYKGALYYFSHVQTAGENESLAKYIDTIQADGTADRVAKNLILAEDSDKGKIKKILIEICNQDTGNIDYITVPNRTEYTISYELYKKLAAANPDMPQIVSFYKLHKYFQNASLAQCAQLILEDMLDIKFSYYTVIPNDVYKEMFYTEKGTGLQKWRKAYQQEMEAFTEEKDYDAFFKKYYEKVTSNLSEEKKCQYSGTYLQAVPTQVAFSIVSGEKSENGFVVAVEETNSYINKVIKNVAYSEQNQAQKTARENQSSIGLSVRILNSTKVNGLASSYQEKLVEAGVNVTNIGNYNGQTLTNTKIYVREAGYGEDLLQYFNNAEIEVGQVDEGLDMCIVLGTADGNND